MRRPAPSGEEFLRSSPKGGRPPKHGGEFVSGDPATWGPAQAVTVTDPRLYWRATAQQGTACTPGWPSGPRGWTTTTRCPSSRAPSSAWPSSTCRPAG